jgi:putative membrane protein
MVKLLINWVLNAIAFLITQRIIDHYLPGQFQLRDITTALIAALLLGLINSTVRPILKFLTFPLTLLTLGLSSLLMFGICCLPSTWIPHQWHHPHHRRFDRPLDRLNDHPLVSQVES